MVHETIVSNRLSPPLPLPRISKRKRIRGKSSRVPFFGDNRTGGYPFTLPPPFSVFTFNFTEPNVTRGLSVGSRSETNSIAPCDSRGRETWRRAAAADRIRPVRECRTEGERHKNEPAPRDLFTRGKSYGFYSIPDSVVVPGERRIQAVDRRPTDSRPRDFFPPYFVIFLLVRTKRTFLR